MRSGTLEWDDKIGLLTPPSLARRACTGETALCLRDLLKQYVCCGLMT